MSHALFAFMVFMVAMRFLWACVTMNYTKRNYCNTKGLPPLSQC